MAPWAVAVACPGPPAWVILEPMPGQRHCTTAELGAWFAARFPDGWFTGPPEVLADREEILVVGILPDPEVEAGAGDHSRDLARRACVRAFRDGSRTHRMRVADEAELRWGRKVSWGARCGGVDELFTTQSVPVMSRLRMAERAVLDTLIDAGVARSRSEALAWCVRLVGRHESDWIAELRAALARVEQVREAGPDAGTAPGTAS